jgi:hypothetical protein
MNEWQKGRDRSPLEGAFKFSWSVSTAVTPGGPAERHFSFFKEVKTVRGISHRIIRQKKKNIQQQVFAGGHPPNY